MIRHVLRPAAVAFVCAVFAACGPSSPAPSGALATCTAPQSVCQPAGVPAYCTNLQTDANNCGTCGTVCAVPGNGGAASCSAGVCIAACTPGAAGSDRRVCAATEPGSPGGQPVLSCTDVQTDPLNCGGCGKACASNQTCQAGACVAAGSPGQQTTACGRDASGAVIYKNLATDPQNCGACGNTCLDTEVCRGGECTPCAVTACVNTCVNTQTDPNNCGSCGNAGVACEAGVKLASPLSLDLAAPLGSTLNALTVSASNGWNQLVTVHSLYRIVRVESHVTTGTNAPVIGGASLTTAPDRFPTTWNVNVPGVSATSTLQFVAYDELWSADAPDAAQHTAVSRTITLNPVASTGTLNTPTATFNGQALADGFWLPLNLAGRVTFKTTVANGQSVDSVEFRNHFGAAVAPLPLAVGASPRVKVQLDGSASIALTPSEIGVGSSSNTGTNSGPIRIFACGFDVTGVGLGCSPQLSFHVGSSPQPDFLIARGTDSKFTLWGTTKLNPPPAGLWLFTVDATVPQPVQPGFAASQLLSGAPAVLPGIQPTPDGRGIYALKAAQNAADPTNVLRFDSPTTANPSFIVPPTGIGFNAIEPLGVSPVALALRAYNPANASDTTFPRLFFGDAVPTQTSAVAVDTLGRLTGTQNGTAAIQQTSRGTLVAVTTATSGAATMVAQIYDPALKPVNQGSPLKSISTKTVGTLLDLRVFPGGEMVWQTADGNGNVVLQAAWFDGTHAVQELAAVPIPGQVNAPVTDLFVPKPGVLVGRMPATVNGAGGDQVLVINFNASGAQKSFVPLPFAPPSTGALASIVADRNGNNGYFAVSDDRSKLLFTTSDLSANQRNVFSVRALDLDATTSATLGQTLVGASEYVSTVMPPRFLHSAASYTASPAAKDLAAPVVTFGELLPATSSTMRLIRPWYARLAPAPSTAKAGDRLAIWTYNSSTLPFGRADSASANALLYLSPNSDGRLDLVQLRFDGGNTATVLASDVRSFAIREDKALLLVARGDGVVLLGKLTSGTLALAPIYGLGPDALVNLNFGAGVGFNVEGTKAWIVSGFAPTRLNTVTGQLVTIDVNTGVRANWGEVEGYTVSQLGLFLNDGQVLVSSVADTPSSSSTRWFSSDLSAPTHHDDLGLRVGTSGSLTNSTSTAFSPWIAADGSEVLVQGGGNVSAAIVRASDRTHPRAINGSASYLPLLEQRRSPLYPSTTTVASTNALFPTQTLPEWSIFLDQNQQGTSFKQWGKRADGNVADSVLLSAFDRASIQSQTRQTADHQWLLLQMQLGGGGSFAPMAVQLSGVAPPAALAP